MDAAAKALAPGTIVTLAAAEGPPFATAAFNPHPLISARVLSLDPGETIDSAFLARRIEAALDLRERFYGLPFYRLVHSEADGLPGLIVDRFGDHLVIQVNSAAMEMLWPILWEVLERLLKPRVAILRNDSAARAQEGLKEETRIIKGDVTGPVELVENETRFLADLLTGQKTGWFFDQRENRRAVATLAKGRRVLDLYSYCGGFALAAARAGAREVVAVDRSAPALALAEAAARLNGMAAVCRFVRAEVFAEMARLDEAGERFDIVVADPPAFVKSKKDLGAGVKGYRKMTRLAAKLVAPRGLLFVASCSHNVELAMFADQIRRGISDAGRQGRILSTTGAGPDHPVHPFLPESAYLKAQLLQLD